jgi:pantothenate kinase
MPRQTIDLEVNGFSVRARFEDGVVDRILRPLVDRLIQMKAHTDGRLVVFLAGPPGAGKSTLSLVLQHLADERTPGLMQALPMDGFHHTSAYLASHTVIRNGEILPMTRVKGSPESYDFNKLEAALRALKRGPVRWPAYDRRLHDVVEAATEVTGGIALVEGNWLLLHEPGFSSLRELCEFSIALSADEALLRDRLIGRKRMGSSSREEAEAHYAFCDRPNILRYQEHGARGDVNLKATGDGALERIG